MGALTALGVAAAVLAGCATTPEPTPAPTPPAAATAPVAAPPPAPRWIAPAPRSGPVLAQDSRYVVYRPEPGDSLASLAKRFLGDEGRQWEIADFNGVSQVEPGHTLVIPLQPVNPYGVTPDGYQTVPILTYHRVGVSRNRMVVTPENFATQLDTLAKNDYRVIRLADLPDFLSGRRQLPQRAVVITFDDGHVSAYQYAYPLLKQYGFPATFFLYTDFLAAKEGLSWAQISEMAASGLIDFQAHSKTHANLVQRLPGETDPRYRERLDTEIRGPRDLIQGRVGRPVTHYAFPYGDANEIVLERLLQHDYRLGLTVNPGGNAFYAHPLMLRRTMVFGEHNAEAFKAALQVFREAKLP